ncbi:MAG: NAD(P)/FAD-dependent oxidoreductase [Microbacteriaceae bacterium]
MAQTVDVIVIGAGINGMVAAAEIARGGRSVLLIDGNDRIGGFIESSERTVPGYLHDVFSSWHPLFVSGGGYAALGEELRQHGLRYANTDAAVTASVSAADRVAIAYRDPKQTAAELSVTSDRSAYLRMLDDFGAYADTVFGALGTELRSRAAFGLGWKLLRKNRIRGAERLLREVAMSGRAYVRSRFDGWDVDQLWTPWLLHAGLGPDQASGGIMFPVMALTMHGFGLPVVAGGAGRFIDAFASVLADHAVEVRLGTPVDRILVEGGRAVGVQVGADTVLARSAVLASVGPRALYEQLLPGTAVPPRVQREAARYRPGRAAMQIHVALDRPMAWADDRLDSIPLVHVTNGSGSTGIACAQAEAGLLPTEPTVVVGQQYVLDPSRVPAGAGALWLQLQEVPYAPVGDSAGILDTGDGWDAELKKRYVDRVLKRVGEFAPSLESSIVAIDAISPTELEAENSNAVHGDPYAGSAELDQNLLWRPIPSAAGHKTAVGNLWHIGASTHPGPGLGGGSGHLVAQRILRQRKKND